MINKKVIIVGAGVAGLSAAIRLQKDGYNVEIYEKEAMPGGKMHQIKVAGHTFDVGPTLVMMPEIYRDLFRYADKDPEQYIPMQKLTPMYDVYFKDEPLRHYAVSSDLSELMKITESKGPKNASGFLDYIAEMYRRYQVAVDHFITRPFRHNRDIYNPFMFRQMLKLKTFDTASNMMAKFMPDHDLQQMLAFQTLYIGVSPKKGPSLYNIIPMIELLYGVHFIKGGMHTMARSMAQVFEELGGRIHYQQPVEKILIEKSKVSGVQVLGRTIPSDYVICNADFPYAMKHLIDQPKARGKYTPEKIDKMDYSCSCLVFYWGVNKVYPNLQTHTFVITKDLDDNLNSIFDGRLIKDPSIYLHVPSVADSSIDSGIIEFSCLNSYPTLTLAKGNRPQFGTYPQTKVIDANLITTLNAARGTLPTSGNSQLWTSYGYYISSSAASSYMWYIDLVNGSDEYRGVYFTSYRPSDTANPSSTINSYQDDNGYSTSVVYWFKYEPITWLVLDVQSGKALLMADLALDSQDYHYSSQIRTIGGVAVHCNNYQHSHIRSWLNSNFYNTAFGPLEKARIQTTTVDNSVASTGYASSIYASANTNDKVFLLSYVEATSPTYGFSKYGIKRTQPSAYAKSQGIYTATDGYQNWWMRSPGNLSAYSYYVRATTNTGVDSLGIVYDTNLGVVPALWISL